MTTPKTIADELAEALAPFSNYACDEPHVNEPNCHNCKARAALTKYREAK